MTKIHHFMARPHTSSKAGRPLARHKLCATGPCHEGRLVNTAAGLGPTFKGVASSGMSGAVAGTGRVARTKRTNSLDDDPFQATTPLWEHIWKSMKNSHIIWLMYVCPIQLRDFPFSWSVYGRVNKRIWWLRMGCYNFWQQDCSFDCGRGGRLDILLWDGTFWHGRVQKELLHKITRSGSKSKVNGACLQITDLKIAPGNAANSNYGVNRKSPAVSCFICTLHWWPFMLKRNFKMLRCFSCFFFANGTRHKSLGAGRDGLGNALPERLWLFPGPAEWAGSNSPTHLTRNSPELIFQSTYGW